MSSTQIEEEQEPKLHAVEPEDQAVAEETSPEEEQPPVEQPHGQKAVAWVVTDKDQRAAIINAYNALQQMRALKTRVEEAAKLLAKMSAETVDAENRAAEATLERHAFFSMADQGCKPSEVRLDISNGIVSFRPIEEQS